MDYLRAEDVDFVICAGADRLARSLPLIAELGDQLQACGARLAYAVAP